MEFSDISKNDICRICFSSNEILISLFSINDFSKELLLSICDVITAVTFVEISYGDGLPDKICEKCAEKALIAYNFKISCEKSDLILKKNLIVQSCEKNENSDEINVLKSSLFLRPFNITEDDDIDHFNSDKNVNNVLSDIDLKLELDPEKIIIKNKHSLDGRTEFSFDEVDYSKKSENETLASDECNNETICSVSNKKLDDQSDLDTHKKIDNNCEKYTCQICEKSFSRIIYFQRHITTHAEYKSHLCPICGKLFRLANSLRQHIKYHLGIKPHKCGICNKHYFHRHVLTEHIRCAHSDDRYKFTCTVCDKIFTKKSTLRMHMKVHTGEKPHSCKTCGKQFTRATYLRMHYRKHTQDHPSRLFTCTFDECDKIYSTKASLDIHIRHKHTFSRPYACELCSKSFSSRPGLNEHKRVHTGEKPEECLLCGKHFVNKQSLKKHMRLHTGERPYACEQCGEKFLSSSRRTEHIQIKHMEKQHECTVCFKRFHLRKTLKSHLRIHSGEKRIQIQELAPATSAPPVNLDLKQNVPEPRFEVIV